MFVLLTGPPNPLVRAAAFNSSPILTEHMMTGTSLKLKAGAYFMMIFPLNTTASKKFQCKMLLQPVSYILVDGKTQTGKDGIQALFLYGSLC